MPDEPEEALVAVLGVELVQALTAEPEAYMQGSWMIRSPRSQRKARNDATPPTDRLEYRMTFERDVERSALADARFSQLLAPGLGYAIRTSGRARIIA